jgi:hypothetical protein
MGLRVRVSIALRWKKKRKTAVQSPSSSFQPLPLNSQCSDASLLSS